MGFQFLLIDFCRFLEMANSDVNLAELEDVSAILKLFEEHHVAPTFDPVPYLSRYKVSLIPTSLHSP